MQITNGGKPNSADAQGRGRNEERMNDFSYRDCILRCIVGSNIHGLNIKGSDDVDEMGICIEPPEYVIGLKHFEQYVSRTKPKGVRSEYGDRDSVIYSLRKWAKLAIAGNPSILILLFAPDEFIIESNLLGERLQGMNRHFIAKSIAGPYLGYMTAQKQRLLGKKGQKRCKRPEYESVYGYDTKYAMHMLRLGFQGKEILQGGVITLPMKEPIKGVLRSVREGKYTLNEVTQMAEELEYELKTARDNSPLPEKPNIEEVNRFLVEAYRQFWP